MLDAVELFASILAVAGVERHALRLRTSSSSWVTRASTFVTIDRSYRLSIWSWSRWAVITASSRSELWSAAIESPSTSVWSPTSESIGDLFEMFSTLRVVFVVHSVKEWNHHWNQTRLIRCVVLLIVKSAGFLIRGSIWSTKVVVWLRRLNISTTK